MRIHQPETPTLGLGVSLFCCAPNATQKVQRHPVEFHWILGVVEVSSLVDHHELRVRYCFCYLSSVHRRDCNVPASHRYERWGLDLRQSIERAVLDVGLVLLDQRLAARRIGDDCVDLGFDLSGCSSKNSGVMNHRTLIS